MRRWWIGVLLVSLLPAGALLWRERVSRGAAASPAPAQVTPPAAGALRSLDLDNPPIRVEILAFTRPARDVVEIRMALTNRDAAAAVALGDRFAETPAERGTLSGSHLTTAEGTARMFVLRDAAGIPQCSKPIDQLGPGARREVWVRFASPGPPGGAVTLTLKSAPPLDGLVLPGQL